MGEGPSRNMYEGPMDKAKGGRFKDGRWRRVGQGQGWWKRSNCTWATIREEKKVIMKSLSRKLTWFATPREISSRLLFLLLKLLVSGEDMIIAVSGFSRCNLRGSPRNVWQPQHFCQETYSWKKLAVCVREELGPQLLFLSLVVN